jgi:hypothetical protein
MVQIEKLKPEIIKSGQTILVVGQNRNARSVQISYLLNKMKVQQERIILFSDLEIDSPMFSKKYEYCTKNKNYTTQCLVKFMIDQEKVVSELKKNSAETNINCINEDDLYEVRSCLILDNVLVSKDDWTQNDMLKELIKKSYQLATTTILVAPTLPPNFDLITEVDFVVLTLHDEKHEKQRYYELVSELIPDYKMFDRCFSNLVYDDNAMIIENGLNPKIFWSYVDKKQDSKPIIVKIEGNKWYVDGEVRDIIGSDSLYEEAK